MTLQTTGRSPVAPITQWMRGYDRSMLARDGVAGLTAAAVVIPKALAYATIAGLPIQVGLYTASLPMAIYGVLGSSAVLSVSTTTTLAILGAAALDTARTADPSVSLAAACATLTVLVGAMLVLARVLRLGFIANFISEPVLTGFRTGVGIVILVDQVPKLLGIHIAKHGTLRDAWSIVGALPETSVVTLLVALATFAVILLIESRAAWLPAPLVGVGGGILASVLLGLPSHGVSVVGSVPGGFAPLTLPAVSLVAVLWPAALGIAVMSFTETIAAARSFTRKTDRRPDADQELLATGAANLVGGLFGAMPGGGGTSQTAVNRGAGAVTQLAGLVTAATALAAMLFLAPLLAPMPQASLAAVVLFYSAGLVSPADFAAIRRVRSREFRWAVAAAAGVVLLGTLQGILVAVVLSMVTLLVLANRPPVYELGRKPGTGVFRPRTAEHPEDETLPGLLILRTEGRVYFANAAAIGEKIRAAVAERAPSVLLIDCSAIPDIEYTAAKMLAEAEAEFGAAGVELWLAALNPEALELLRSIGLADKLGRSRMFFNVEMAVAAYAERFRPAA
ncbi:SulP family inorganic anion transporter [Prosthecomicrobium sp. N25]|uniref:SulP family inorganic anion transporter n=1 Tax=Prosthecomicrobium sp. N25 TaxID=3129254 RepID=UPI003077E3C5